MLEVCHLAFAIGDHVSTALSFAISGGGLLVVRGPSGSGKTSLLRVLARLQEDQGGQVYLNGCSWREFPAPAWRRQVLYVSQRPVLFAGTVRDNFNRPLELAILQRDGVGFDETEAARGLARLMLDPDRMTQDARTLSGGEASRVALLRAVLVQPKILLLDEPTAALDEAARDAVYTFLEAWRHEVPGRGVILVSHSEDAWTLPGATVLEISP